MAEPFKLAVLQTSFTNEREKNVQKVTSWVEKAAKEQAHIILIPELFETEYFCREKDKRFFELARPFHNNSTITHFQKVAEKNHIAIPISFFERDGERYFNSVAFIDETGKVQGKYRKTFIPTGPGYEEKYYFEPGDTGFHVWKTSFATIGVGICWDQWFPESARAMTDLGADLLLYPTCIGSEPEDAQFDTQPLWQKAMIGHCVSNTIALGAANRIGTEGNQTYYGSSFIADHRGNLLDQAGRNEEKILLANLDPNRSRLDREDFGLLRDYKIFKEKNAR